MSDADRTRWEQRYAEGSYTGRPHATELLEAWLPQLPRGRALDLACGAGRNAIRMARAGFQVDGVDIASAALERAQARASEEGLSVNWVQQDLDHGPLPHDDYLLITVARFIARHTAPWIVASLAPGGFLVYEHHLLTGQDVAGPKSTDFRVKPNELLRLFSDLRVLHYRESIRPDKDGREMAIAELVACNGDGGL